MHKWSTLLPVALIAAALALSACGSDDESTSSGATESDATATKSGGGSDEGQVTQVIKTTLTTTEPSRCSELETDHFVQQIYFGLNTENSVAICKLASPALGADSVRISKLEIQGDSATVEVAVKGAVYDGQVLAVTLVKENGQWKMDSVDRFIDFDANHFAVAFAKTHREAGDLHADQQACVTQSLQSVAPDALEKVILAGRPNPLGGKFKRCLKKAGA